MPRTEWAADDIAEITRNATVTTAKPRRLAYGSHYVYGGSREAAPLDESEDGPRPTFARGGFSEIWGAVMLPANDCDMAAWPIRHADLAPYYQQVLDGLPLSAVDDGLSRHFPVYRSNPDTLGLPPAVDSFLNKLNRSRSLSKHNDVAFGQARLAVRVADDDGDGTSVAQCRWPRILQAISQPICQAGPQGGAAYISSTAAFFPRSPARHSRSSRWPTPAALLINRRWSELLRHLDVGQRLFQFPDTLIGHFGKRDLEFAEVLQLG